MTNEIDKSDRPLEEYKALRAHELMLNERTSEFERAALQPLFLLNGGAVVAFLTLLGAIWEKGAVSVNFGVATWAVLMWCAGLVTAALATGAGYLCQSTFAKRARLEREIARVNLLNPAPTPDETNSTISKNNEMETARESAVMYQRRAIELAVFSLALFMAGAMIALDSMAP